MLMLGASFILLTQIAGAVSFRLNAARLKAFDPWQPRYSNSSVPYLARWDSGWYAAVAEWGYFYHPGQNSTAAFFPLYPMLIKTVGRAAGVNYFYAGQIISWLAFLGFLQVFFKLLRLDFSGSAAWRVLFFTLLYPWSFFLAAAYTESLFLLLVISSFYFARKNRWPLAALLGGLASLTRLAGIFLLPALLWEYYSQNKKLTPAALWLGLIPAGLAGFMLFLKLKTGYFLAFLYSQSSFGRQTANPLRTIWWDINNTFIFFKNGEWLKGGVFALTLFALGLATFLLVKNRSKIRLSYQIFAWPAALLPLFTGTTTSLGRYLLAAFPIFLAAGLTGSKIFRAAWFVCGGALLLALTYSFVGWYFVV